MKFRHAAGVALVGWYLMLPLVKDGKTEYAPIQDWAHVGSYDTAKECENAAYENMVRAKQIGDKERIVAANGFECIASDDPRLKSN